MTIRRLKTYTGGQGYVYQYYYVGKRPATVGLSDAPAVEYVFDVTADEIEDMMGRGRSLLLDRPALEEVLATLGVA